MATSKAPRSSARKSPGKVQEQLAYVLHSVPYRETSLVVEMFGQSQGRFAVIAKGAKRPRSNLRAVAQLFQPLWVRFTPASELHTLLQADWQGGVQVPLGEALISAFYMNELLLRLLQRDDPHELLFLAYERALQALGESGERLSVAQIESQLRRFEWTLLKELGYAPDLSTDLKGEPILADSRYLWLSQQGFMRQAASAIPSSNHSFSGKTLLDLENTFEGASQSRVETKQLMRLLLAEQLGDRPLKTRTMFRNLQQFVQEGEVQ